MIAYFGPGGPNFTSDQILRDMSMSFACQINCEGGITWPTRTLKVFLGGAVKPVTPVLFISYTPEL